LDEQNPNYAGLAQENGFGSAYFAMAGKTPSTFVHLQKRVK
jgi:hypothetical protein